MQSHQFVHAKALHRIYSYLFEINRYVHVAHITFSTTNRIKFLCFFFVLFFLFQDESKRHIVGQCNQHAEAIAKIDEVSEQFDHLSVLSCEQQNDAKMLTNKCAELATNVEQCEWRRNILGKIRS